MVGMLTDTDKKILEILSKQLLITKGELVTQLSSHNLDGAEMSINRLRELGYIEKVESLGTCFVITQKGMRVLKECS